jgi:hypothetical protein
MVLAFFLASAFAPNHPTKRPAILVMTVPTAQVLSVIMVASVNLDCRRDERRWGQGQGQGGRAQANNNSQDQNCGAHDGLRSLPESIAKLALWHCFYVEQAIVLHDSIPAATRIEICVHRPKFGEIGCWNCILKSRAALARLYNDNGKRVGWCFLWRDRQRALTDRCVGCYGNPVRKARARRGIAVVIDDSQFSRFGIQATSSVKSDFDPERNECPKSTMHSSAKGDPFFGCFGCGRLRQAQKQSGKYWYSTAADMVAFFSRSRE